MSQMPLIEMAKIIADSKTLQALCEHHFMIFFTILGITTLFGNPLGGPSLTLVHAPLNYVAHCNVVENYEYTLSILPNKKLLY